MWHHFFQRGSPKSSWSVYICALKLCFSGIRPSIGVPSLSYLLRELCHFSKRLEDLDMLALWRAALLGMDIRRDMVLVVSKALVLLRKRVSKVT
jgi:hypothetical protein